jgi:hypothetical protein
VDQEQINVAQAKLAQALVETSDGAVISLKFAIQFSRDEHLLARDATIPDAFAHTTLVTIAVGCIDMTIASFDCGNDYWRDLVIVERCGAQANLRYGVTVAKV